MNQCLCINCRFIFLSYPSSVIGYPELTEKTGFPTKDLPAGRQVSGMTEKEVEFIHRH